MAAEIHVGDIGTDFIVTLKDGVNTVDLSSASLLQFVFKKPNNTIVQKSGTFVTNGSDGKLRYISTSGDIDEDGIWHLQVKVRIGNNEWSSNIGRFRVHRNLNG